MEELNWRVDYTLRIPLLDNGVRGKSKFNYVVATKVLPINQC